AWFRALLALLSIVAVILAMVMYWGYFNDNDVQSLWIALYASEAIVLFLATHWLSLRLTVASRWRLVVMARRLEGKYHKAALVVQTYLKDSGLDSLTAENGQD
ncbi:MAG: hypothetical protein ACRELG_24690, partial [Gemmataceae bacterium]